MSTEVSIVVPAFDEEHRLPTTLDRLSAELPGVFADAWEIVVVDDGSTDRTRMLALDVANRGPVVVVACEEHRGKGAAIRRGVSAASGDVVVLLDADLPIDVPTLERLVRRVASAADLVVASRRIEGARVLPAQPWARRWGSTGFLAIVRCMGFRSVSDPQCGAKAFRRGSVGPVVASVQSERFSFDLELIERCRRRGLRVVEMPVHWRHVGGSSVRPWRDAVVTLRDVALMRRQLPPISTDP